MITIKRIHVKIFRSLVDETIELSDYNFFVGKNDSGKSNVLKALNLFFNSRTDFNTPYDFVSDYSKFAKRGEKQAREIIISLDVIIPDTFKEKGVKTWTKVWRAEGLHSDNLDTLFKSGSKGITLLKRIQYMYIPAVKSNEYTALKNNVFRFNVPALENDERQLADKICIEHYYSDTEIETVTDFGHLYMAKDFNEYGVSSDGHWIFQNFSRNSSFTHISIIDSANRHLQKHDGEAKIISKVDFADYVINHPDEFNFENFRKIFDVISAISIDVNAARAE